MRAFAVALLIAITPSLAMAEPIVGWAFLAAEHSQFPTSVCGQYAKESPRPFIAALADTFGTKKGCLRAFMRQSKGKTAYWQYYAGNGAGRRKALRSYEFLNRLDKDEYNKKLCGGDLKTKLAITKQARRLKKRCEKAAHASAICLLSPELESQFTECALNKWINYAERAGWKREQIVHNPVVMGPYQGRGPARYVERHGVFKRPAEKDYHNGLDGTCPGFCGPCGITGDGVSDDTIVQWLAAHKDRNDLFLSLWCPEHQGLSVDSGQAPEPRRRNIRVSKSSLGAYNRFSGSHLETKPPTESNHNTKACSKVQSFNNGNVAKESDHGGFVAVMVDKLDKARLVAPTGRRWMLRYTGVGNPYKGKDRYHYRHALSFARFPNNLVLKGKIKGKTVCWKMNRSGERHE